MKIGSLCSGYGGLELGVQAVYGGTTAWVSDIDKGACKILAHRFPDVPNIGDFTKTDWADVEPVDIITAGFPCQPVSGAGKRLGDQDERWLWDDVARAVSELRPGLIVLENVRGLLTAGAGRLFGRVLGTLANLGYDVRWHGLRAADVGAAHNRFRIFITAADTHGGRRWEPDSGLGRLPVPDQDRGTTLTLLPTPRATEMEERPETFMARQQRMADAGRTKGDSGMPLNVAVALLPTPAVNDMGEGKTVEAWDEWTAKMREAHGNGNGHGNSLAIEALRRGDTWGEYAPAIARWVIRSGRFTTPPTVDGKLSPRFVEWLMGLPDHWVTGVPNLSRNEQLKALGNGVVPQQAAEALRVMASWGVAA